MAPAQPRFLMHCGVNRTTQSGRVATPEQCVSREGALKAITIEAAHSLQLEKEAGSIVPGKLANFTILADNPVTCDAAVIKDITVWGTIHEGRVFQTKQEEMNITGIRLPELFRPISEIPGLYTRRHVHDQGGCDCTFSRRIAEVIFSPTR